MKAFLIACFIFIVIIQDVRCLLEDFDEVKSEEDINRNENDSVEERKRRIRRRPQYGLLNPNNPNSLRDSPQPGIFIHPQMPNHAIPNQEQGYGFQRPIAQLPGLLPQHAVQQHGNPVYPINPTGLGSNFGQRFPVGGYAPLGYPPPQGYPPYAPSTGAGDSLRCVPRLLCEAVAAYSANDKGTASTNPGGAFSLLALLTAVAGGQSPLALWGGAVAVGTGGNANQCHKAFPQCPADPEELLHYFNHNTRPSFQRNSKENIIANTAIDNVNSISNYLNDAKLIEYQNNRKRYVLTETNNDQNDNGIESRIQNKPVEIEANEFFPQSDTEFENAPNDLVETNQVTDENFYGDIDDSIDNSINKIQFKPDKRQKYYIYGNLANQNNNNSEGSIQLSIPDERDSVEKWVWRVFQKNYLQNSDTNDSKHKTRSGKGFQFPNSPSLRPYSQSSENRIIWAV